MTFECDSHGVPHVVAIHRDDVYRTLGYLTALDRLPQLDRLRRAALGRLAEIDGPGAIAHDVQQRELDFATAARAAVVNLDRRHRQLLDVYASGIESGRRALLADEGPACAADCAPWHGTDSLLIALYYGQLLGGTAEDQRMVSVMAQVLPDRVRDWLLQEADDTACDISGQALRQDLPDIPVDELATLMTEARATVPSTRPIVAPASPPGASNAWATSKDGQIVLANDLHLPLTRPGAIWCASCQWPGGQVRGAMLAGVPVFVSASNDKVAWGVTRLAAPSTRLISVEVNPGTATYRSLKGIRPLQHVRQRVEVSGGDALDIDIERTHWGPLRRTGATAEALWASYLSPGGLNLTLCDLLDADGVEAACATANASRGAPLNMVFADRSGRVGWTVAGGFVANWPGPEHGTLTGAALEDPRWIDSGRLPRAIGPDLAMIVNANNGAQRPQMSTAVCWNASPGVRATRISERLIFEDEPLAASIALQSDVDARSLRFWQLLLLDALGDGSETVAARKAIAGWDGTASILATGLAEIVCFRELMREALLEPLLRRCRAADPRFVYCWQLHEGLLRQLIERGEDRLTPPPLTRFPAFVKASAQAAVTIVAGRFAAESQNVRWGAVNQADIQIPAATPGAPRPALLSNGLVELPGCEVSVNLARPDFAAVLRLIVDLGLMPTVRVCTPTPQACDAPLGQARTELDSWLEGRSRPLPECPAEIGRLLPTSKLSLAESLSTMDVCER